MDPISNPTPTPAPVPGPEPVAGGAAPLNPVAPVAPVAPEAPVAPVTPPAPVAPVTPPAPVAPVEPVTPPAPVTPASPVAPNPVTPPVVPLSPAGTGSIDGIKPMDPILRPEPVSAPDPVEEELKAPMKAAAPVPGSIGSAVSGPADSFAGTEPQTPSVSFNDPAMQPDVPVNSAQNGMAGAPKKNNMTLIILIVVAVMTVIALAAVFILQFIGGTEPNDGSSSSGGSKPNSSVAIEDTTTKEEETTTDTAVSTLSCDRAMDADELSEHEKAVSGTINIKASFSAKKLTNVSLTESIVYDETVEAEDGSNGNSSSEIAASDLTATTALDYYLPISDAGEVTLDYAAIKANYESLDFTCEAL